MPEPRWSLRAIDVATDEVLLDEAADRALPTASVGKVLVLTALAERLGSGDLDGAELVSRSTTSPVADSGLWQHLALDALPLVDVAVLVGAVSDNWATNVLVERLGLAAVQEVAPREGLRATQLWDVVRDHRGPDHPSTLSTGTAADWADVFARLHRGTWVSAKVSARVLGWLATGVDHSLVASALGLDPLVDGKLTGVVNKTGSDDDVRCDVGLLVGPRRTVAYACLGQGPPDQLVTRLRRIGADLLSRRVGA